MQYILSLHAFDQKLEKTWGTMGNNGPSGLGMVEDCGFAMLPWTLRQAAELCKLPSLSNSAQQLEGLTKSHGGHWLFTQVIGSSGMGAATQQETKFFIPDMQTQRHTHTRLSLFSFLLSSFPFYLITYQQLLSRTQAVFTHSQASQLVA